MKLNLEQRTKLFQLVRDTALKNTDKVRIISSDFPNLSFQYDDDKYEILYYYNQFGAGVTTGDVVQISLYDKNMKVYVKFDCGDYIFMKNRVDMMDLVAEIHDIIFDKDNTDTRGL